jgi:copper chaperone CopZ
MTKRTSIHIDGMHCTSCVRRVKNVLESHGAQDIHVEIGRAVIADDASIDDESLRKNIQELGFSVISMTHEDAVPAIKSNLNLLS